MDLQSLRALWMEFGIPIRRGATSNQLTALRDACLPFHVPASLNTYFEIVDGMSEHEMGPEHIRFWTLDEVLKSMRSDGDGVYFDIADVLIMADMISFRIDHRGERVVAQRDKGDRIVANSFAEFIDLYVADPESVVRRMNS